MVKMSKYISPKHGNEHFSTAPSGKNQNTNRYTRINAVKQIHTSAKQHYIWIHFTCIQHRLPDLLAAQARKSHSDETI